MDALILAAGRGTRLGHGRPKCLVEVGGRPLIDHQLAALEAAGVDRVSVVVGYKAEEVLRALPSGIAAIENVRYATTNSLYSFALAEPLVRGDVLVLNADVLFHPEIVRRLTRWSDSAIAYDSRSGTEAEEMKLAIRGGLLERMSKELPVEESCGENLGVLALSAEAAKVAFNAARHIVAKGRLREWLASSVNVAAIAHPLHCLDVADLPWVEIDFPHDLERARTWVLPAIDRSLQARGRSSVAFAA